MAWNEVVKVPETDVHHQFALILKAPPYWNQNIKEPVSVFIELFRSADGCKSAQFPFTYTPNKNTEPSRKRARRESTLIPDVVTNINQMPIVPTYQQATENSANLDFFGNNAGFSGGSSMQCGYSSEQESYFSDSQENFYTEFNMDLLKNFTHPPLDLEALQKEFNIDLELGLETDAAVELAQAPKENVGLSEFVKIKTLVQAFQDEWNEKQLQVLLVKILEKNDENILFALIEEDNFNEFQELAIMLHKYKLIKYLHEKNDVHQNCLHFAVLLKKHHMLQSILAMGLDINAMDQNGDTPLHLAVYGNYLEGVEKLVANKKLKIDLMNHNGSTALEFAARNGNLAIVKILGESGASFTKKNPKNGNNLMHEAVSVDYCSPELIKHLLEINEEFFSEDKNLSGYQAYDLAKVMSCNYEILKLFKNEDELSGK